MHPRQASIIQQASELADRTAAKKKRSEAPTTTTPTPPMGGQILLWKYEDPDGKPFYLEEKRMTVKSPWTGKSFPFRPKRHTPAQVGKEMKDERKGKNASEEGFDRTAGQMLFWEYTDPDSGKSFLLAERHMPIRSPFTGKSFTQRPVRHTLSQLRDLENWTTSLEEETVPVGTERPGMQFDVGDVSYSTSLRDMYPTKDDWKA